jgi:hypothetical protein
MEKIPTAEEFFEQHIQRGVNNTHTNYLNTAIEFAKLHREAQLKAILEKATIETKCYQFGDMDEYHVINKDSILDAYPLTNIK